MRAILTVSLQAGLYAAAGPEAWLPKQLYVERRYGHRRKRQSLKRKPARRPA